MATIRRPKLKHFIDRKEGIAVVGLGYVGLPLAVGLARHFSVTGFDVQESRIRELKQGIDRTMEVSLEQLKAAGVRFTSDEALLASCRLIIVAVPTPIDVSRRPDLAALKNASSSEQDQFMLFIKHIFDLSDTESL